MEEEGEPKDPVVEAALDQGLGTRKRGLGPLPDFSVECIHSRCRYHRIGFAQNLQGGLQVKIHFSANIIFKVLVPILDISSIAFRLFLEKN